MNEKVDLDAFIVKGDELDETLLAETVKPYLARILPDGTPEYTQRFQGLSAARKLLASLLVQKIKFIKNVTNIESEEISIKNLINKKNNADISEESIKKSLNRELKSIIKKGENGYYVPNYNLQKAKEYLENG